MTDDTKPEAQSEKPKRGRPPKPKTVAMCVERDYWPGETDIAAGWPQMQRNRVRAGIIVDLETEAAMDGLETGILSRVKG